jgi:predicted O-methyltransferase YrrM
VEVGSWLGRSTKVLAMNTKGVVYAIDHWMGSGDGDETSQIAIEMGGPDAVFNKFQSNLEAEIRQGKVIPIKKDSGEAITELLKNLKENKADMVFIDTCHHYENVKREIELYYPILKHGGIMSGHDYYAQGGWWGVKKAVDEIFPIHNNVSTIWYKVKDDKA